MKLFKDIEFKDHPSIENATIGTITLTNGFDAVLIAHVKNEKTGKIDKKLNGEVLFKKNKKISENYQFEIYQNDLNDDDSFEIEDGIHSLSNLTPEKINEYLVSIQELGHEEYSLRIKQRKRDNFFKKFENYIDK
jgi:hypothetical protein